MMLRGRPDRAPKTVRTVRAVLPTRTILLQYVVHMYGGSDSVVSNAPLSPGLLKKSAQTPEAVQELVSLTRMWYHEPPP